MRETRHSVKRSRERLGLNKKATKRNAEKAFIYGVSQSDVKTGSLSKYFYYVFCQNKKANNIRIYNQYVYIFVGENLITVYSLPKMFVQQAMKIQKRKDKLIDLSVAV